MNSNSTAADYPIGTPVLYPVTRDLNGPRVTGVVHWHHPDGRLLVKIDEGQDTNVVSATVGAPCLLPAPASRAKGGSGDGQ